MGNFFGNTHEEPVVHQDKTDAELALEAYTALDFSYREHDIVMESSSFYNETERLHALKESIELEFSKSLAHLFMKPDVEFTTEHQSVLNGIGFRYIAVMEQLGYPLTEAEDKVEKAAKDLKDKANNVKKNTDKTIKDGKEKGKKFFKKSRDNAEKTRKDLEPKVKAGGKKIVKAIKELPSAFRSLVDNTYGRLKKMDSAERKKAILENGMYRKISRLIRGGLRVGTALALGPVLGSIFMISSLVHSIKKNSRLRTDIIYDMEQELAITKEKIRDADATGDKEAKYQLMRIKDQLERDIRKVHYDLNDRTRATSDKDVN